MPLPFAPRRTPARRAAFLGLVPLGLAGGFAGGRALRPSGKMPLPPALDAELSHLQIPFGKLALYKAGPGEGTPLLLVHSINAAGNSYEVKPLFDHYAAHRPVYALDLPGYGFSDRNDRIYTPRLMTDAILAAVDDIRRHHGPFPIDVMALSLSCEFLGRAASEHPLSFRSVGLVSPTGFESAMDRQGRAGATFGKPAVRDIVSFPLWGRGLFDLVASRASMRFFLAKTWGSPKIDEGLLDYDYLTAHQPDAEHVVFSFLSGFLFSRDILTIYKGLSVPVWMCHGVRGDFVDYGRKSEVEDRANWTVQVFRTGALPQFEVLDQVTAAYDSFLARAF